MNKRLQSKRVVLNQLVGLNIEAINRVDYVGLFVGLKLPQFKVLKQIIKHVYSIVRLLKAWTTVPLEEVSANLCSYRVNSIVAEWQAGKPSQADSHSTVLRVVIE